MSKLKTAVFWMAFFSLGLPSVFAGTYTSDLKADLKRGLKNIVSAPAEIGIGFQEYHEGPGRPLLRQAGGLVEGTFKGVFRLFSGVWDLIEAPIPGNLQGFPTHPETFF